MIAPSELALRRRQVMGMVCLALAILLFATFRAGWHAVFSAGWWRLW